MSADRPRSRDDLLVPVTARLWLIAFAGEAGCGKSTVSRALGRHLRWPVIDKDDVRDLLDDTAPGLAYDIMWNVARRQLLLGLSVICDSPLTGGPWHAAQIAAETAATLAVVECRCPDEAVWRQRINARKVLHLPGHHQTDWDTMRAHRRPSAAGPAIDPASYSHLALDTLAPVAALCEQVVGWLAEQRVGGGDGAAHESWHDSPLRSPGPPP